MHKSATNAGIQEMDYNGDYKPTFHDFYYLMKFRVTKILLVSSLYDAFILEEDGLLTKQISGEYQDLALSSPPQVVRVPSGEEALAELTEERYDLVITMTQLGDLDPFEFGRKAKEIRDGIPVVLLATDPGDIPMVQRPEDREGIDKIFYWNGDSALFLAITKYVEDMVNIGPDTEHGMIKAILVVEDSPKHYSTFLPIIYTEILRQTQALIAEGLNEHEKWFRKKSRPKILLAENYDEGKELYDRYKKHLLGVITDITFHRGGQTDRDAGFRFIEKIDEDIPILIQSSDPDHGERARKMNIPFLDKHSETLEHDLTDFLKDHLGFGEFVFLIPDGKEVGRASDIKDFVETLSYVPLESISYHASRNDFSTWLMARGEIALAMELRPNKVSDFKNDQEMKDHLIGSIMKSRQEKRLGVITNFSKENFEFRETFTRLGGGSLGGKGRGLAFLAVLLNRSSIRNGFQDSRVRLPDTLVIGTDVFDRFMKENALYEIANEDLSDDEISRQFINAAIPQNIRESLADYLSHVNHPLAVRSSSLLEDSQNQPFAGIYSTYMLPNNCDDEDLRLDQLCQAIKLVYASTYSRRAKAYIQTTLHKAEEKMAVIIQKVVGQKFDSGFYPIYSGVGQSYNFYPVTPLKREEGIVTVALGLGKTVMDGGNALSFSPSHPNVIPGLTTPEEIFQNTQNYFYSLDINNTCFDLSEGEETTLNKLDISQALDDGTLAFLASTYDLEDNRLRDTVDAKGPKVITFAGIRKYNMLPLTNIIRELLVVGEKGMGRPVEIEFAGTIGDDGTPEFHVLQIRPLVTLKERRQVVIEESEIKDAIICTQKVLGNGILEGLKDVVLVPPETFDSTKTLEIAREVGEINRELEGTPYILIGPGRWGTRDRWLGIPVDWEMISWVRTIVEVSLENFQIDPSHGTHFFHNITSLGIMYFTVPYGKESAFINWDELKDIEPNITKKYVRHLKLPFTLNVKVDGRSGSGIISKAEAP
jgi:hypothetical protein